jgi:large subunit ribosomal protein L25
MEQRELIVEKRSESGTAAARRLRRRGLTPAILYGRGMESLPLAVDSKTLRSLMHAGGHNVLLRLRIQGGEGEPPTVMIKEMQRDAVTGMTLNVDFQRISLTEKVTAQGPVVLFGEAPGVKQGGVLDQILREVEVECLPTDIPPRLELDISQLEIAHSLHVSDLVVPSGVEITTDPAAVVVTMTRVVEEVVAPPVAEAVAEEAAAAPAEGEEAPEAEEAEEEEK